MVSIFEDSVPVHCTYTSPRSHWMRREHRERSMCIAKSFSRMQETLGPCRMWCTARKSKSATALSAYNANLNFIQVRPRLRIREALLRLFDRPSETRRYYLAHRSIHGKTWCSLLSLNLHKNLEWQIVGNLHASLASDWYRRPVQILHHDPCLQLQNKRWVVAITGTHHCHQNVNCESNL